MKYSTVIAALLKNYTSGNIQDAFNQINRAVLWGLKQIKRCAVKQYLFVYV